jgi:hypothetical protein
VNLKILAPATARQKPEEKLVIAASPFDVRKVSDFPAAIAVGFFLARRSLAAIHE